jgi:POT family proton-dependent oligopeptide transporter
MAPAGDSLAEPIAVAGLRAEIMDEKRASMSAERKASIATVPRPATADATDVVPVGGVTADGQFPNAEELGTLRRVPNKIPLKLFSIAFIELCERFSYYGCTVVCKL